MQISFKSLYKIIDEQLKKITGFKEIKEFDEKIKNNIGNQPVKLIERNIELKSQNNTYLVLLIAVFIIFGGVIIYLFIRMRSSTSPPDGSSSSQNINLLKEIDELKQVVSNNQQQNQGYP